jgi:hypothetical protein
MTILFSLGLFNPQNSRNLVSLYGRAWIHPHPIEIEPSVESSFAPAGISCPNCGRIGSFCPSAGPIGKRRRNAK